MYMIDQINLGPQNQNPRSKTTDQIWIFSM